MTTADRDDRALYLAHLAHLREPEPRATTRDDHDDDMPAPHVWQHGRMTGGAPCIIAPNGVRYDCTDPDDLERLVARINSMRGYAIDLVDDMGATS